MKICIVGSVYPRSHTDWEVPWHRETVNRCRARGFDMSVFVPAFRGLRTHIIDGVMVHRFRYCPAPFETLTHDEGAPAKIHKFHYKLISALYILCGAIALARLHRREKFDVLHVHWPFPHALMAQLALLFAPAKLILNFHGASLLLIRKYKFVRPFLTHAIKRAGTVIVNSGFTGSQVRALVERDLQIIPYGTTLRKKPSVERKTSEPVILSVGRLIERKGFSYLIQAMPLIAEQRRDVRLVLVGGGVLADALKGLAEHEGVADRIEFTGKVSQDRLEYLFASSDLFVLPSVVDDKGDTEGLGVVLIEALSYGLPVIGSEVGGIPDIIHHNETGRLFHQRDPEAIAEQVLFMLNHQDEASRMAAAGFEHINRTYNWDSIIEQLADIYTGN